MTEWPFLNSVALVVLTFVLGVLATWWWKTRDAVAKRAEALATANAALLVRVTDLERQNAVIGQAMLPISALFQATLVKHLTHNHTPEMDDLLARISTLSEPEGERLAVLLKERVVEFDDPEIDDLERDAAAMLPYVIKRVKAEAAEADANPMTLRIVTITVGKPEGGEQA